MSPSGSSARTWSTLTSPVSVTRTSPGRPWWRLPLEVDHSASPLHLGLADAGKKDDLCQVSRSAYQAIGFSPRLRPAGSGHGSFIISLQEVCLGFTDSS